MVISFKRRLIFILAFFTLGASSNSASALSEFLPHAQFLAGLGVINVQSSEYGYRLSSTLSRAEGVKMTMVSAGVGQKDCRTLSSFSFTDVNASLGTLCGYIEGAVENQIISSFNTPIGRYFSPNQPITRGDFADIIVHSFDVGSPSTIGTLGDIGNGSTQASSQNTSPTSNQSSQSSQSSQSYYTDVPSTLRTSTSINRLATTGCINTALTTFRPYANISRGEAFKIMSCLVGKKSTVISSNSNTNQQTTNNNNSNTSSTQQTTNTTSTNNTTTQASQGTSSSSSSYIWSTTSYGSCSKTCGGGVQSRTVSCKKTTDNSVVADSYCIATGVSKPVSQKLCNVGACTAGITDTTGTTNSATSYTYSWNTGGWGTCSKACGDGNQTRVITCQRNDSVSVADTYCASVVKPSMSQGCNTQACSVSVAGSCGSVNGTAVPAKPTNSLCATGIASSVTGTGPWNWTCSGNNGGSTVSCSATTSTNSSSSVGTATVTTKPTVSCTLSDGTKLTGSPRNIYFSDTVNGNKNGCFEAIYNCNAQGQGVYGVNFGPFPPAAASTAKLYPTLALCEKDFYKYTIQNLGTGMQRHVKISGTGPNAKGCWIGIGKPPCRNMEYLKDHGGPNGWNYDSTTDTWTINTTITNLSWIGKYISYMETERGTPLGQFEWSLSYAEGNKVTFKNLGTGMRLYLTVKGGGPNLKGCTNLKGQLCDKYDYLRDHGGVNGWNYDSATDTWTINTITHDFPAGTYTSYPQTEAGLPLGKFDWTLTAPPITIKTLGTGMQLYLTVKGGGPNIKGCTNLTGQSCTTFEYLKNRGGTNGWSYNSTTDTWTINTDATGIFPAGKYTGYLQSELGASLGQVEFTLSNTYEFNTMDYNGCASSKYACPSLYPTRLDCKHGPGGDIIICSK